MMLGDLDRYMQKNETRPPTYTRINSRCIKNLNVSHNTIKVLEENIGRKISDILYSNIFIDMSARAKDIRELINKWVFIKIKSFFTAKENRIKMKNKTKPNCMGKHIWK